MKKIISLSILVLVVIFGVYCLFVFNKGICPLISKPKTIKLEYSSKEKGNKLIENGFVLLKTRKDSQALVVFEEILAQQPNHTDAFWGKAEILRRQYKFKESEAMLKEILKNTPDHAPSLISLAYIRYRNDKLNESLKLVNQVLKSDSLSRENKALAYMMLGSINSKRSVQGSILNKIRYGTKIKCYFLKAKETDADLPEVHLGLGSFYLFAPSIVGGNLNKAIEELEFAIKTAPDFATPYVRLAQAYKKKGMLDRYNFYLEKAMQMDPENEVFKELR